MSWKWTLTRRQAEALQLRADGCSEKLAAEMMGISVATQREYIKEARDRLQAKTTHHAVALGIRQKIIR